MQQVPSRYKESAADSAALSRLFVLTAFLALVLVACGGTAVTEDPSNDLCSELNELDAAIDAIDGDSVEEFQTTFDAAQEEYREFAAAAEQQYPEEVAGFEEALADFERELTTNEGEGLIGGILDLASAAAELAAQADRLDDTIDCPNT